MIEFSAAFIDGLVLRASFSPRGRQHYNVHSSHDEPCQRLFNAIGMDSYIRPHRHLLDPRRELLMVIRGSLAVLLFDGHGRIDRVVCVSAQAGATVAPAAVGVEVEPGEWHTVIALEPGAVLLEVKAGPFLPSAAKEFAAWAPEEGSSRSADYLVELRDHLGTLGVLRKGE